MHFANERWWVRKFLGEKEFTFLGRSQLVDTGIINVYEKGTDLNRTRNIWEEISETDVEIVLTLLIYIMLDKILEILLDNIQTLFYIK